MILEMPIYRLSIIFSRYYRPLLALCAEHFSMKGFPFFSKVWLIEGRFEWRIPLLSPAAPPPCLALHSARHWVWWVRQWSGDSDPPNLPLPAPWLLDIVPNPGSAPEEEGECIHDEA